ncbi:hypothetical protein Bcav_0215 [Beutenbergia cavernae DSM 12333]|uniref:Secreted protein n=1 Tax=Beutenbergia cavernae (strain ATCC BAA-8 / DSM 12333 / CCUG 43141 / JCM 11478 / NBRC 16432 / NCIMB 13614 / HKI 0122) TaxID=471853 RepID=C5BVP0_BEUC1|nr:hypothetical protein [Beutenbergia cavernae]ACQ78480.1 hypothetical protein Bcav_0215 [Beutenbergia cavernae DSM 12333]
MRRQSKILRRALAAATLTTAALATSAAAAGTGTTASETPAGASSAAPMAGGHICRQEPSNCWTDVDDDPPMPGDSGGRDGHAHYRYSGPRGDYGVYTSFDAFDEHLYINAWWSRGSVARVNVWIEGQGWVTYRAAAGTNREAIEIGYGGDVAEGSEVWIQTCWGESDAFCTGYAKARA